MQATADLRLLQRLLDSHREVWLRLFWGHWSFLLGPGAHKVLFVPSKSLFPQSFENSGTRAFLEAHLVNNPPAMRKTWVQSLGWEDPLEKGRATHSSILAWRIPWTIYSPWGHKQSHMTE